eukprot:9488447-Pyramimonas_sp.AAC.1
MCARNPISTSSSRRAMPRPDQKMAQPLLNHACSFPQIESPASSTPSDAPVDIGTTKLSDISDHFENIYKFPIRRRVLAGPRTAP